MLKLKICFFYRHHRAVTTDHKFLHGRGISKKTFDFRKNVNIITFCGEIFIETFIFGKVVHFDVK